MYVNSAKLALGSGGKNWKVDEQMKIAHMAENLLRGWFMAEVSGGRCMYIHRSVPHSRNNVRNVGLLRGAQTQRAGELESPTS